MLALNGIQRLGWVGLGWIVLDCVGWGGWPILEQCASPTPPLQGQLAGRHASASRRMASAILARQMAERLEVARKELAFTTAKKELRLEKLRSTFIDSLQVERVLLYGFRSGRSVASFRTPRPGLPRNPRTPETQPPPTTRLSRPALLAADTAAKGEYCVGARPHPGGGAGRRLGDLPTSQAV